MLLSICIPSYNRPDEIKRLLNSIDCKHTEIEIVICEDCAPLRNLVREVVEEFATNSVYKINYIENENNLGYDRNLRKLIEVSSGDFVLFMGDDDRFFDGALDKFINFIKNNLDVGYILRSYYAEHLDGRIEIFKYFNSTQRIECSLQNSAFLFKRTVSIAGVTFKRSEALKLSTSKFDGSLLYQLYLVLEISFKCNTVYCDIPVAIVAQTFRLDKPHFGASKNESKFQPGKVTPSNSIAFTKGFFEISKSFDIEHNTNITKLIRKDLSKYSYPILSIQRKNGFLHFLKYSINLAIQTGINESFYYYFYSFSLLIFGEKICDNIIIIIKNKLGYTPKL
jgi:abequosyltransferase